MTEESMALVELPEKAVDSDFRRGVGQSVLLRLMEIEAKRLLRGAGN